jgi:hypothetical protein
MPVIRNSARAFIFALLILAAFHGVMSVLGLGTLLTKNVEPPSPDRALQMYAMRVGIDAILLFAGHWLLRSYGLASRLAYGLMGGAAMAVGYAFALTQNISLLAPLDGTHLSASVLPILVGMIAATMYNQFAGRELLPTAKARTVNADSAPTAPAAAPIHFDGPVQVRTSIAATAIASVVPAATAALVTIPAVTFFLTQWDTGTSQNPAWANQISRMTMPAYLFMLTLFATAIPAAIVVGATHVLARAVRRIGGLDYVVIGAIVGAAAFMALVLFIPARFFPVGMLMGALMGGVYRRFAGLEPLPLPEAVLATDRVTLVGEHDPARKTRAVIMDG